DMTTKIKGWKSVLEYYNMTQADFDKKYKGYPAHLVGYEKECMIVNTYNQGRKADLTDGTTKCSLWFTWDDPSGAGFRFDGVGRWLSGSRVCARLLFVGPDAEKNARDAVQKFLPELKESRVS